VLNFSYFSTDFPETFRTAVEIRNEIKERGWETVIAFQTRNPMHRAHEELCRMAQKELDADGILVHMLLGKLKKAISLRKSGMPQSKKWLSCTFRKTL